MLSSITPHDLLSDSPVGFTGLPTPISDGVYFQPTHADKGKREQFENLTNEETIPQLLWTVGSHEHSHGFASNVHFALHYASKLPELSGKRYAVVCSRLVSEGRGADWNSRLLALRKSVVVPPGRVPTIRFRIVVLGDEPSASFVGIAR